MNLKIISKKALLLFLGDIVIIWLSFFLAHLIRSKSIDFWNARYFAGIVYFTFFFYIFELYSFNVKPLTSDYIFKYLISFLLSFLFLAATAFIVPEVRAYRTIIGIGPFIALILTYIWRIAFFKFFKKFIERKKNLLIVGYGKAGKFFYNAIKDIEHINVIGFLDDDEKKWGLSQSPCVLGGSEILCNGVEADKVDEIVLAITHLKSEKLLKCLLECKHKNIDVIDMPTYYEEIWGKIPIKHINDYWLVSNHLKGVKKTVYNRKLKRFLDVLFSLVGLILTIPFWFIVPLLIKMTSNGPVIFKQERVGLNGEIFTSYKFRTMKTGREKDRAFAGEKNDPRVTLVGRYLRKFRIDEIPQLINVIKGEMSLIGPRALIPEEVKEFKRHIPYFDLRHSIKPGVTGWAQVNYKHGAKIEDGFEKLQYDLFYIKNLSPILDFQIILRTIRVVLLGFGAR